jgi:hypothetical protein
VGEEAEVIENRNNDAVRSGKRSLRRNSTLKNETTV